MPKYFFLCVIVSVLCQLVYAGDTSTVVPVKCESAKEFVAAFNYLHDHIDLVGNEGNAVKVAEKVSAGCNGSAKRFVNAVNLLLKAELDRPSILDTGIEVANSTEEKGSAYFDIFQKSFLTEYLDLDVYHANKIARQLSVEVKGDHPISSESFENIVKFCLAQSGLGLPRPKCADLALKFSLYGSSEAGRRVDKEFIDLYEFLIGEKAERMDQARVLDVLDRVLSVNALASENFKTTYNFVRSEKALKLPVKDAILLGVKVARHSEKKNL